MKIFNETIYGLEESIIASNYPMSTDTINDLDYEILIQGIRTDLYLNEWDSSHLKRAKTLGNAEPNSGHDCYLKGITVQADLTCSQTMHMQILRYHFIDIVSSQSKMHCITKMDISKQVNCYVCNANISLLNGYIDTYNNEPNKENYLRVIYNIPMGLELTFRFTTNYLQLKTIYNQRKNHKLIEWKDFCNWILTLPQFKELTKVE